MFSSSSCIVSYFTLKFLLHFEFILMCGVKYGSNFTFFQMATQLCRHHLLKKSHLYPSDVTKMPSLSYTKFPYSLESLSGFSILFPWSVSLFMYQYHTVLSIKAFKF